MKKEIVQVSIPVEREKLADLLYIPTHEKGQKLPSIVIFHGHGSSKKRYADRGEALSKAGILTLVFEFRGCGEKMVILKTKQFQWVMRMRLQVIHFFEIMSL